MSTVELTQPKARTAVVAGLRAGFSRLLRLPQRRIAWRFAAWYAALAVGALLSLALATTAALEWEEGRASRHRAAVESALLAQAAAPLLAVVAPSQAALDQLTR